MGQRNKRGDIKKREQTVNYAEKEKRGGRK